MTRKPLTIKSDFAILDVKKGRKRLFKDMRCTDAGRSDFRVPVTITGFIVGAWGADDGVSREFEIDVTGVSLS